MWKESKADRDGIIVDRFEYLPFGRIKNLDTSLPLVATAVAYRERLSVEVAVIVTEAVNELWTVVVLPAALVRSRQGA